MISGLEKKYLELIRPDRFIQLFKDGDDFREWLELGTIEDIEACTKAFIKFELYEHCRVMQEVIQEKRT